MGHWGTEPLQSDSACDWVDNIVTKHIKPAINSNDYDKVRAAVLILKMINKNATVHTLTRVDGLYKLATDKLLKMLNDTSWINRWKDPKIIRISILNQIYSLWNKK